MKKWVQGDKSLQDAYINILSDLNSIANKIEQDAYNGVIHNVTDLTLPDDGVQRGTADLFCNPGYKVDRGTLSCKPCPPGFYMDSSTGNCEFCKKGEYMNHEGASQCDMCPEGYSTLTTGTKDITKCLTCLQLKRKFGTIVNCRNVSATLQKCNLTCLPGRAFANGQSTFVEYTCGDSTSHEWLPTDKIPECVQTSAMTELIEALTSLNEAIEFMQNNTESVFQAVVNDVEYTLVNNSVDFVGTVTCPSGYAGADGLCTQCPVGTYLVDFECINCEIGTYQPLTGQTECLSCPSGYTTATLGSSNISECVVKEWGETDAPDYNDDEDENGDDSAIDNNTTVIIIVIGIVVLVVVIAGGLCLWKYIKRGGFTKLKMLRSSYTLSDDGDNCLTEFNTKEAESASAYKPDEIPL